MFTQSAWRSRPTSCELLAGRVRAIDLEVRNCETEQPNLRVKAQVIDPHGRIKAVKVLVVPAHGAAPLRRLGDGSWPADAGALSKGRAPVSSW